MTVTWIQLNSQLLRLTGDARYGNELERSYYNHLAAAQRPDGAQWCYYTALEGAKPYGPGINCCVSSGPRGMALAPTVTYLKTRRGGDDCLNVNLFEASSVTTMLGGRQVTVRQQTGFPNTAGSSLVMRMTQPARFALKVRAPAWAMPMTLKTSNQQSVERDSGGWLVVPVREWNNGDIVTVDFKLGVRLTPGTFGNEGRSCLRWGPVVLAYDADRNPGFPPAGAIGFADEQTAFTIKSSSPLLFEAKVRSAREANAKTATFVPFAEAGVDGGRYQIWLRAPGAEWPKNDSLFAFGNENRSRGGNVAGSICDGDAATFVVTFNAQKRDEDWFAVALDSPVSMKRIVFAHGRCFHDGGWFDASAGNPRIQIQREKNSTWETVGTLDDYPATTATDNKGLKDGQSFTLRLKEPVKVVAIRVIGKPAHGDNPAQAFSSCAELQGFAE